MDDPSFTKGAMTMNYSFSKTTGMTFDAAVERVTDELKKEGFGVITSIDVKATMKQKLGIDFQSYVILGACNPSFAHRALTVEPELGLLLPCNVIVYTGKDHKTVVSFFDPVIMGKIIDNSDLILIATEVKEKLLKVFNAIN
jgi:uncharacterized protein (DUF302 family)